jgi:glutamate synthase (NADPH/NADH) small chain
MPEAPMRYTELKRAFQEVKSGFSQQEAVAEASRCIKCQDAPCAKGCPAGVDVAKFIGRIAARNPGGAIRAIKEDNILAGVCARICPQRILCERECSSSDLAKPIEIGLLQRFAADQELEKGPKPLKSLPANGVAVAVVGAGPAGLAAAAFLKRLGYDVDLYEARSHPGGVLAYGIPAYRLPKAVVQQEVDFIRALGVRIHLDHPVVDPEALLARCRAVFLATGCGRPYRLGVPGEDLQGVVQALDMLQRVNEALLDEHDLDFEVGPRVVVIGGGNAAMDAAVTARKLGADDVRVLYRRSNEEMPAWEEERRFAVSQGVRFNTLTNPVRFLGSDGKLTEVECVAMRLGEPDESGRPRPLPVAGSAFRLSCDSAILALGQGPAPVAEASARDGRGWIQVDPETMATSVPGLYVGGDLVRGSDMAVGAVGDGKRAAFAIDRWIQGK